MVLIERGANVSIKDKGSQTALLVATEKSGSLPIVEALVNAGIDISFVNKVGNTALHLAAKFNRTDIAELLLNNSTNPRTQNNQGATPGDLARINMVDSFIDATITPAASTSLGYQHKVLVRVVICGVAMAMLKYHS
ncbi:unnamed protein product, partial [Meganyctiphanes norvegica]